jgi:hypothetical protein
MEAAPDNGSLSMLDLNGLSLRALAERVRLPAQDRSALAAALARLRSHDETIPAVLTHNERP